jgi:hypothetical protein
LDEYQEQPSSEQLEQQPGEYEEGKYNMNLLSLFNTISYCILILCAYKDFPSHFISFIYILWVAFWLVVVTVHVFAMLGKYFVSVKYVFVCIKLMCVYVKLLKI